MKTEVEDKLDRIHHIWSSFITEFNYCSRKIEHNSVIKINYFIDILGYFKDTIDIVFTTKQYSTYSEKFSFTISFLQAIYIHEDFVQEMLEIFKTGIDKGILKKDPTYYLNREIRNELVGHPIRKNNGGLISSTLFSYNAQKDEIQYLRYHKDNDFKFEDKTFKIADIQERHMKFLEKYFDIILEKLKIILEDFLLPLNKLENVIKKRDFKTVLKLVDLYFESIYKSDYCYDKHSLIKIYNRREEHKRYQHFIDCFYIDLQTSLADTRASIKEVFESKLIDKQSFEKLPVLKIEIIQSFPEDNLINMESIKESFHYEIGKIATNRDPSDFDFFGGTLKTKFQSNKLVIDELEHMKLNIFDEIEYYTSLGLIRAELKEE